MKNALPPLARAHVPTKRAPTGHLTLRRMGAFVDMVRVSNIQGDGRFMFAAEKTSPHGPSPALVRPPKMAPPVRITKAHCIKETKTYRKIKPKKCGHFHCYFFIKMPNGICVGFRRRKCISRKQKISIKCTLVDVEMSSPCVPGAKLVSYS